MFLKKSCPVLYATASIRRTIAINIDILIFYRFNTHTFAAICTHL